MSMKILNPGILSLLQDAGRFGQHQIGLTNGGPLDPLAFHWANRLCGNTTTDSDVYSNATTIEVSIGGFKMQAECATRVAVTGGEMPVTLNGKEIERWRTHTLNSGDTLELGYSQNGCRAYIAVSGGFKVSPSFGSSATVVRESLGGLNGQALKTGDVLP
ncbi:biotin-dependent carboxyltransferase family protein, partial [Pseudomaricurvus sp.]|uniref:5-oxoprolinase subunit C family protein n=1 Tax=Pseudomaricurvus sp. TaxID=2004510 RepID=UPI003F6B90B9